MYNFFILKNQQNVLALITPRKGLVNSRKISYVLALITPRKGLLNSQKISYVLALITPRKGLLNSRKISFSPQAVLMCL